MIGLRLSERYQTTGELGRGGMGVVYRATDAVLGREVAIKFVPPSHVTPESEERFRREAQVVARLDHPGIVPILDFGRHGDSLFLVMPVAAGQCLRGLLREGGLTLGDVVEIGIQVADALQFSHSHGVVHRDVKPGNIMVAREDGALRVRVTDFGLALVSSPSRMAQTGPVVGTMSYMSPEQVLSRAVDHRTDVYSLGVVLFECLTGRPPFAGELQSVLYRIVHDPTRSPRECGADVDPELDATILSCLSRDPAARPPDAHALAEALRRCRSRLGASDALRPVARAASARFPRVVPSPFVGREPEMSELRRRLDAAVSGECHCVLVGGEPGCGRSRLLDEFEAVARARGVRVLRGRFSEQNRAFPYQGFYDAIEDRLRPGGPGGATDVPDLSDLWPDLVALFPPLAETGGPGGEAPARTADADAAVRPESPAQVYELLARTLLRIAAGRPLVLLFEDLHGAETSIGALQYIVPRLTPTPTLIVGTYRTTAVVRSHPLARLIDDFEGDRRFSALTLGPLAAAEHRLYLETLMGGARISRQLAERLRDRSEGNVFFTKELVRALLESGAVVRDESGAWALAGHAGADGASLPATIRQVVERRVQRMAPEFRDVLSVAAVIGRSFGRDELAALAGRRADLDEVLARLFCEGLFVEWHDARADVLGFSSAIVHDVVYGQVPRRRRRALHRAYAERIETRNRGRLESSYPQLLWHFAEGDAPEKAVEYGLLHARRSLDAFSPEETAYAARTVIDFLDETDPRVREPLGDAHLLLARAHRLAGNLDGALSESETAARTFSEARLHARSAEALLFAAETAWGARRSQDTDRLALRGIEAARAAGAGRTGGATGTLRELLGLAATLANFRGDHGRGRRLQEDADALVAGARAAAPEPDLESDGDRGGTLVVALPDSVKATEPAEFALTDEVEVLSNVFETLVTTDHDGVTSPSLCERWEARDDGRTFVLTLRRDVCFHDGHAMTADDVRVSFQRALRVGRRARAAFAAIDGAAEFARGDAQELRGVTARSTYELEVRLAEPLRIFPALLTDPGTAIVRDADGSGAVVGTGPFRVASRSADRLVLVPSDHARRGTAPRLDRIEFRVARNSAANAAGLRSGEFDVTRNLTLTDFDSLLAEPRFRKRLVEAPLKKTCFLLFNCKSGPAASDAALRSALAGVLAPQDLVWRSLGRSALPATSLIPPGVLGHDPGRRRTSLSLEEAQEALRSGGCDPPIRLAGAVHPSLLDRYRALLDGLVAAWHQLGVELLIPRLSIDGYLAVLENPRRIDVLVGPWAPDFEDPDSVVRTLFDSATGVLRGFYSSPEADRLLLAARSESGAAERSALYRAFESRLADDDAVVPLFYDVDRRISGPLVSGLTLRSTPPFVNYTEVRKRTVAGRDAAPDAVPDAAPAAARGVIRVAFAGSVRRLDPAAAYSDEECEVCSCVFETLTRHVGDARIVPWLADSFRVEDGGRRHVFRLSEGVRFHDGRPLTVRDVRHSFERLLRDPRNPGRWLLKPVVGARELMEGGGGELEGFRIHSSREFSIVLEEPVAFLPTLLSYPAASIVSEGDAGAADWDRSGVGTGPFRVAKFDAGRRLELSANDDYWRRGFPRSDGIEFTFGAAPDEILAAFRAGRCSIASGLRPEDAEALRRDAQFARGYRESPTLSTYFLLFNVRAGACSDLAMRQRIARAINVPVLTRQSLGRLAVPANGLIPPGLLGHRSDRPDQRPSAPAEGDLPDVELSIAVNPLYLGAYEPLAREFTAQLQRAGIHVRRVNDSMDEFVAIATRGAADLVLGRWVADFPDADTFTHGVLHSTDGYYGRLCGTPDVDRLAKLGRAETDPARRGSIYGRIEQVIEQEALLVPLFHERVYRIARPDVEGLTVQYWTPTVRYEELHLGGATP